MDLPRSTVSKLLNDLEAHLGVKLMSRTPRATTVTLEGQAYYHRAIRLLAELEDMDADVRGNAAMPRGRLRVDIGSSLANLVLIPALPAFQAAYPDIELMLGVSDRTFDLVGDGIDCAIRGGTLADSSLVARKLCELNYVVVAAPEYLARHGKLVVPSDLNKGHVALAYFSALDGHVFPLRFMVDGVAQEVAPTFSIAVNESTSHLTALLAGLGVGQTFEFVARPYISAGVLIEVLPGVAPQAHPLHLLYPANRHPTAKLRVFIDWVADIFRDVARTPS